MRKILFIDIDGTLIDYETKMPASAAKAIQFARANGHKVILCSGRSKGQVTAEVESLEIDGYIGGNGSYVEYDNQVISHIHFSLQQCSDIVNYLHRNHLEFYLESNNGLFPSANFNPAADKAVKIYCGLSGKENAKNATVDSIFPTLHYNQNLCRDDINKISYLLNSYEDYLRTKQFFPQFNNGTWGGLGENALFGEIGPKGNTKGQAISILLNHLHANKEDTIAFGDAKNDLPMFDACGLSCCMGSGGKEAKEAADYVSDDVNHDGLYKAFQYFNLI